MTLDLKQKYIKSGERARGALREQLAELYLKLLFHGWDVRIRRVGIGVGTSEYVPGRYRDYTDKFDFALVGENGRTIYVEVTGSPYPKEDSVMRFGQAMIGILPDKQREAEQAEKAGFRVYYLLVNEAEGEIAFLLPYTVARHGKRGEWAAGEKPYILVPWQRGLFIKPYSFRRAALIQLGRWG